MLLLDNGPVCTCLSFRNFLRQDILTVSSLHNTNCFPIYFQSGNVFQIVYNVHFAYISKKLSLLIIQGTLVHYKNMNFKNEAVKYFVDEVNFKWLFFRKAIKISGTFHCLYHSTCMCLPFQTDSGFSLCISL